MEDPSHYQQATFAAGCFWDVEAVFRNVDGVITTVTGYTGGQVPDPTYDLVESGKTGHVEAVGIVFDPSIVSYETLLDVFWALHDPTRTDGQGDFCGAQYRSVIFFHNEGQKTAAWESLDRIQAGNRTGNLPVLTEILPASIFWAAEECHQQFYEKCGRGYCVNRQADN
jgi:peptide-methionine (S)-S-oxide reductase